jgi:hypothetical protein
MRGIWQNRGRGELEILHEEIEVHGRADCVRAEAGGDRHAGRRGYPPEGVSEQTFYRWKKVYGGLGVGDLRRVKQLEDENRKLNNWLRTSASTSTSCRTFW